MVAHKRRGAKAKKAVRKTAKKLGEKAAAAAGIEEYYPLIDGRIYRYDFQSPEWPYNNLMTIVAKNVKSAGGKTMADWEETFPDPDDPESHPVVHGWKAERSAEGAKERWPDVDWETWMIRTPLRAGATWERDDGAKFTIASLTERVEVPAGVYEDCLHVTYENEGIGTGELYYAKDVGMVRSEQRGEWVPYDYKLVSVSQGPRGAAPLRATAAGGPRMMAAKGTGGR